MATRREIITEIERLEPRISEGFKASIFKIRGSVALARLEEAIRSGDLEAARRIVNLSEARFSELTEGNRSVYLAGGEFSANQAPASLGFAFNVNSPRAARYLQEKSSDLLNLIINDQNQMIRDVLSEGIDAGVNPRTMALDLVGRIDRRTGRRVGGRLGLTANQSKYVSSAKSELLSGDTTQMRNYLQREARDKRFDSMVLRAINDQAAIPVPDANRISARYSDNLLQLRGETIARTEALESFHAGSDEALNQAIEEGYARAEDIVKEWSSSGDARVRDGHRAMDGQVVGVNELFVDPVTGDRLRYPADSRASAASRVNCRCAMIQRVDWSRIDG